MNRKEKAIEYLNNSIAQILDFKKLENAKIAFFGSIEHSKNSIIPALQKFNIFSDEELNSLRICFDDILLNKNKGGDDLQVYHSTWPKHGMVVNKLTELKNIAEKKELSLYEKLIDSLRFSKRELIIGIVIAAISAILTWIIK